MQLASPGQGNRFVIRGKTFPLPHQPWEASPAVTHNGGSSKELSLLFSTYKQESYLRESLYHVRSLVA